MPRPLGDEAREEIRAVGQCWDPDLAGRPARSARRNTHTTAKSKAAATIRNPA